MRKTKIWSLLATVAVFLCCNPAIAGSPDALPAANEGVCNELLDATPGLYGLCLAFCEAQDCQPDYSLENPFEHCTFGSQKVLERYDQRKGAGDPDMPCIQQTACPCWSGEELAGLRYRGETNEAFQCLENFDNAGVTNLDRWMIRDLDPSNPTAPPVEYETVVTSIGHVTAVGQAFCRLRDLCADGNCLQVDRPLLITAEEHAACEADVIRSAADRGLECYDPNP